jgi:hypothetical protein
MIWGLFDPRKIQLRRHGVAATDIKATTTETKVNSKPVLICVYTISEQMH